MKELFSVQNKTALITGASSGIGKHFARTLAKHGANVILIGRNQNRLNEVANECEKYKVKTLTISADVKDSSDVAKIISESQKTFSTLDIAINSAGIGLRVPVMETEEKQWDDVLDINLKGTFLVAQAAAKWMISTKTPGKIINVSSAAAFHISNTRVAYSASKIGVESITRTMALDLAQHKISVNCISPGFFVTDLTENYLKTEIGKQEITGVPMQRAASVQELEGTLLLLASNASSYITGSILHVDGGFSVNKV